MREAIGIGETVELAKEAACKELGVESYEAEFEILEMPTKKTFGIFGGSPAKVRVYIEDDPAQVAADYLKKVLSCMGIQDPEINIQKEEGGALLTIKGDDVGFIIGHRGETLDALQYLAGLVANHVGTGYYRIALDIGNYREKRRETLESLGRKMAEKSLRNGRNCSLEPMNPYERRIIHTAVQTVEGAKSWSEGEDLQRHVVIGPIEGERIHRRPSGKKYGRRKNQQRGRSRRPQDSSKPAVNAQSENNAENEPRPVKSETKGSLYERVDLSH
jgi:spoIIIJ-associated protein